jgi:tetratricopeptide (TPR) repeat protein
MLNQCPKCGQKLNEKSHCTSCDITYRSFRLIKEVSKSLYNEGLQKSKVRDLSGAVESLNRSIKYDKRNIDARNLLGLVYFELGETVMALRQWVVSQNIQPELNVASNYLKLVQDNQVNLDRLSTAIKKYNQALVYIRQNSRDLAIINLKKVISLNPKFVKAYTLLALLYVKEEEVSRAKNILLKVLLIDKTNYVAHKYYEDLFEDHKEEAVIVEPIKTPNCH